MKKKGFTLIELLVVIAIIGLLATISVVSFSTSREKGRIAKGSSFEGQILRSTGDDLIARWDVTDCSGATVADSSGNNNNLTLVAGVTLSTEVPSGQGCSLAFNGTSQLTVTTPVFGAQNTKTFWMRTSTLGANTYLFDGGANNNYSTIVAGRLYACTSPAGCVIANTPITANKWYFIAIAYDGISTSIYIDGSLDIKQTAVSTNPTTTVTLGNYGGGGGYRLTGNMDNVRIYNRFLSGKDVHQLYAEGLPQYLASE